MTSDVLKIVLRLPWLTVVLQVQSRHIDVSILLLSRQQSPPSKRHSSVFVNSSQTPSRIMKLSAPHLVSSFPPSLLCVIIGPGELICQLLFVSMVVKNMVTFVSGLIGNDVSKQSVDPYNEDY